MLQLLDYFALVFVRTIMAVLRFLPEPLSNLIARGLIGVLFLLMPRLRTTSLRNLKIAFPEHDDGYRAGIFRESKNVLARNIVRFAKIPDLQAEKIVPEENILEFKSLLQKTRERCSGTGVIFATMHFGCFEQSLQLFTLIDRPIATLARGFGLEKLDRWWNSRREYFGSEIFDRRGGFKEVVERISRGQDVAVLCDQNVKRNHATFVDFFGRKASATKTLALASLRTGAPIMITAAVEIDGGKVRGLLKEIDTTVDPSLSSAEKTQIITQRVQSGIEEYIREYPAQWFWIHRRWKTQPTDEAEVMYN